ncbi:hypothetical protein M501DRAFT_441486 [Patellaria atrata CBS 101060]|uniref:NADH:ubiquinone oxidoreductase intermediate-associated protein 30 domain-containing protein n=1 Tax=Patellaria atrata CBS 101060 TaxID=1346257 RepID=A0A9P4S5D3_9PEZI|nr:hypothetical protein M501DRAFT_441486 [Patellaria atrata CBS 101060]
MVHIPSLLSLLLTLSASASASASISTPKPCRPVGKATLHQATYDDLIFTEPDTTPIGTYKGLIYSNFYVDQDDGFIRPTSGLNVAHSYSSASPRLITASPNSSFNLRSLSLACVQGYPQPDCTVVFRGLRVDGATWMQLTVTFPALDNTQPRFEMLGVSFPPQWTDLRSLEVVSATIEGTGDYTGVEIDDLVYETRRCRQMVAIRAF